MATIENAKGKWIIEDGKIVNEANRVWVEKALTQPYPGQYWRINPRKNGGKPYHIFLPDVAALALKMPRRRLLVHVLPSTTHNPNDFKYNGTAVYDPISCTVSEELNGRYEVQMKVAYNDETTQYLTQSAILKVPFIRHNKLVNELFRITSVTKSMDTSGKLTIDVTAAHLFYDLNNRIVLNLKTGASTGEILLGDMDGDGEVTTKDVMRATEMIANPADWGTQYERYAVDYNQDGAWDEKDAQLISTAASTGKKDYATFYNMSTGDVAIKQIAEAGEKDAYSIDFEATSDIKMLQPQEYNGITVTNALIGADNSFINVTGGELYRELNRFSINYRMEGSTDAGYIAYGYNMTSINFTLDYSQCFTNIIAVNSDGGIFRYGRDDIPSAEFPHRIYVYREFSFTEGERDQFESAVKEYCKPYFAPQLSMQVTFADVYGDDTYEDYWDLANYEVGDKVIVYHKDLGINYKDLEIIKKTYDVVNQMTTSIEVGNFYNARARDGVKYMGGTVSTGQSKQEKEQKKQYEEQKTEQASRYSKWDDWSKRTWKLVASLRWEMVGDGINKETEETKDE